MVVYVKLIRMIIISNVINTIELCKHVERKGRIDPSAKWKFVDVIQKNLRETYNMSLKK